MIVERHVTLAFFAAEAALGIGVLWAARLLRRPDAVRVWVFASLMTGIMETFALLTGRRVYLVDWPYHVLITWAMGIGEGGGGFTFIYVLATTLAKRFGGKHDR